MVLILPAHAVALIGLRGGWNDAEAAVYWLIHVFRLPLFFLVAGFFAALLLEARGTGAVVRNRLVRIGIPLVVGVAGRGARVDAAGPGASRLTQPARAPNGLGCLRRPPALLRVVPLVPGDALRARRWHRALLLGPQHGAEEPAASSAARSLIPHWVAPTPARHPVRPAPLPAADLDRRGAGGKLHPPVSTCSPTTALFFAAGWALFAVRGPARADRVAAAPLRASRRRSRCRRPSPSSCCRT